MNVICASSGIVDADHPGQGILDMARAGFENTMLDLTMYCSPTELESVGPPFSKATCQNKVKELKQTGYKTGRFEGIFNHAGTGKHPNL